MAAAGRAKAAGETETKRHREVPRGKLRGKARVKNRAEQRHSGHGWRRLQVWREEPGGAVRTSAREHQQSTHAARVSRRVVESENAYVT